MSFTTLNGIGFDHPWLAGVRGDVEMRLLSPLEPQPRYYRTDVKPPTIICPHCETPTSRNVRHVLSRLPTWEW